MPAWNGQLLSGHDDQHVLPAPGDGQSPEDQAHDAGSLSGRGQGRGAVDGAVEGHRTRRRQCRGEDYDELQSLGAAGSAAVDQPIGQRIPGEEGAVKVVFTCGTCCMIEPAVSIAFI